ncbi:RNA polymerase sigma factor [Rhodopirellula sp. MGV]|uniref:RNA polymerase sigma factor n=1 Tax=Rhodopirellula sp. MGV TaxID=2023130 RepID=UPI000B975E18|nr:RNA polymerase sigma factor [Rhodopirellula sp. MGV]OYP31023.1 hypothetical protein CGZ80_21860 [Rhodopirellula sp. MGV]PNY34629.1 RNA polymerase sigma factor [Rhodopirellula baltica]
MSENTPDQGDSAPRRLDPESDPPLTDDSILWKQIFAQSENGLRKLLASKLPQPADIDDCLQAVRLAVLQNSTPIPVPARRAWLFRVASNEAALWWRRKSRADRVMEAAPESSYAIDRPPPAPIEQQETQTRIRQAIERLPREQREVVRLRLIESLSFRQIADQLEIPLGTALTRMRRAMDQLRSDLEDFRDSR